MPKKPATTLPAFTPVPRERMRRGGWSAARQIAFIEALAETGSVRAACRQLGVGEHHIYKLRHHPDAASFRKAWEAALDIGIARIEDTAMDRALNGVEEPVYHKGEIIGARTVYNDRLLMFLLRNRAPRRFAQDGARGFSAIDRQMLARLKKEWRREWEREREEAVCTEPDYLDILSNKLKLMQEREIEVRLLRLQDPDQMQDEDEEDCSTELPEEMRRILPRNGRGEVDDGWDLIDGDACEDAEDRPEEDGA